MKLRSLLFVPGDRPDRMEKAKGLEADALILDLEDSVALARKADARLAVAEFLRRTRGAHQRFVRINALDTELADQDLDAVIGEQPDASDCRRQKARPRFAIWTRSLRNSGTSFRWSAHCNGDTESSVQARRVRGIRRPPGRFDLGCGGPAGRRWCIYGPTRRRVLHAAV